MAEAESGNRNLIPQTLKLDIGLQRKYSFLPEDWEKEGSQDNTESDERDVSEKPITKFCTGSKYLGEWNELGIAGKGIYKFPHGVIYDGHFNNNGEFHGSGVLVYPNGQRMEGIWKQGKLSKDCNFVSKEGALMSDGYCKMPDRRFHIEVKNGFGAVGREYLTNAPPPPRTIPHGCYDTGEGFYDPKSKCVFAYADRDSVKSNLNDLIAEKDVRWRDALTKMINETVTGTKPSMKRKTVKESNNVIDIPSLEEEEWIVKNCRKAWDEPVGYNPYLYES